MIDSAITGLDTNGVVFDNIGKPGLELQISLSVKDNNDITRIKSVRLCKLSEPDLNLPIAEKICSLDKKKSDSDLSDSGIVVCQSPSNSCNTNYSIRLDSLSNGSKVIKGLNNYFLEVTDIYDNLTQKNFSFIWSPTNLTNNYLTSSAKVSLDKTHNTNSSLDNFTVLPQVELMVKKLSREVFTLNSQTLNQKINGQLPLQLPIPMFDSNVKSFGLSSTPPSGCLPWIRKNKINTDYLAENFKFNYLKNIGPFCGIKASGKALPLAPTYTKQNTSIVIGTNIIPLNNITNLDINMIVRHPQIPEHTIITSISNSPPRITVSNTISDTIFSNSNIEFDYSSFTATADVYVQSLYIDPVHYNGSNFEFNVDLDVRPRSVSGLEYLEINFYTKRLSGRLAAFARVETLQPTIIHELARPVSHFGVNGAATFGFFDNETHPIIDPTPTLYEREGLAIGLNLNDSNAYYSPPLPTTSDEYFRKRKAFAVIKPSIQAYKLKLDIPSQITPSNPFDFKPFTSVSGINYNSDCFTYSGFNNACVGCTKNLTTISSCGIPTSTTDGSNNFLIQPVNPYTLDFGDAITVFNMNIISGDDVVTSVLNSIAQVQIPKLKPLLLQRAIKDVMERVIPEFVNVIFDNLDVNGISFQLWNQLPDPFKNLKLNLNARLSGIGTNEILNTQNSLNTSIDLKLNFSRNPLPLPIETQANNTSPLSFSNSSALLKDNPIGNSTNLHKYKTSYLNNGLLLALHPDIINQALQSLWKIGALNLNIDSILRNQLTNYVSRNNTSLIQMLSYVSKGSAIRTILSPTKTQIEGRDSLGNPVSVLDTDDISYKLDWLLPPVVKASFFGTSPNPIDIPRMKFWTGDLRITIKGKRGIINYDIASFKIAINSILDLKIYAKLPDPPYWAVNPAVGDANTTYRNAIRLIISKDPADFRYTIEPGEGLVNNPIGQDPKLLKNLLDPLIDSFILPMLNDILYDIPLQSSLEKCGLGIYNLELVPIEKTEPEPFLLFKSLIYDYNFSGDCKI